MTILKDTSLCAIVRDEMINPAQLPRKSGIRSFVESHVPYVEQAVIVDTGSRDGTREELEQLASEFPNLKVYDKPFRDYASARNHSLSLVKTRRALVLDVDEVVTQENFERLGEDIKAAESIGRVMKAIGFPYFFILNFVDVNFDGSQSQGGGHTVRLFNKSKGKFCNETGDCGEYLYRQGSDRRVLRYEPNVTVTGSEILHFMPARSNLGGDLDPWVLKYTEWYAGDKDYSHAPSSRESFKLWKQPNPFRWKY